MSSSSEHEADSSQDSPVAPKAPGKKRTPKSATTAAGSTENLFPLAAVTRIAQNHLEKGTLIAKDAKDALNKIAGHFVAEFVKMVNDCTKKHKRTTIKPDDIMEAAEKIDIPGFFDALSEFNKNNSKQGPKGTRKAAAPAKRKAKKEESEESGDDDVSSDNSD